jgi:hypothetical protein
MVVRVVPKRPTEIVSYIDCIRCNVILSYNPGDTEIDSKYNNLGNSVYEKYVTCSVCNKRVVIESWSE